MGHNIPLFKIAFWCLKLWRGFRETVDSDIRCFWCSVDDRCALPRISQSRNIQQLSGSVRRKVGPVPRHRPFPYARLRFQCLAGSDQFHRMGCDRTHSANCITLPVECEAISLCVSISISLIVLMDRGFECNGPDYKRML